jgi:hypothetical protein
VVIDRLHDAREGVRALSRLIQLALEFRDPAMACLEIVHSVAIGTIPGNARTPIGATVK